ncbi:hypothetical protein DFH06DRAFT_1123395 [Mycena polygramma]|nr:hypothetical protein DFH06DRAFT_1123395 [Mycena polygramma]
MSSNVYRTEAEIQRLFRALTNVEATDVKNIVESMQRFIEAPDSWKIAHFRYTGPTTLLGRTDRNLGAVIFKNDQPISYAYLNPGWNLSVSPSQIGPKYKLPWEIGKGTETFALNLHSPYDNVTLCLDFRESGPEIYAEFEPKCKQNRIEFCSHNVPDRTLQFHSMERFVDKMPRNLNFPKPALPVLVPYDIIEGARAANMRAMYANLHTVLLDSVISLMIALGVWEPNRLILATISKIKVNGPSCDFLAGPTPQGELVYDRDVKSSYPRSHEPAPQDDPQPGSSNEPGTSDRLTTVGNGQAPSDAPPNYVRGSDEALPVYTLLPASRSATCVESNLE